MNTKKTLFIIPILLVLFTSVLYAEPVKKFKFIAASRSEQVDIIIDDSTQQLIHQTPDRTTVYSILDYDYTVSLDDGEKIFKAVIVDNVYNTAYDVLLFASKSFADIRIGKKRLTFNIIRECTIEPLD